MRGELALQFEPKRRRAAAALLIVQALTWLSLWLRRLGMNTESSCATLTAASALSRLPDAEGRRFTTIFEHGTLLVEIYAPRVADMQNPHTRDEVYFVASGRGEYVCGDTRQLFGPTDLLFAAAGVKHRFENFTDDLAVWVLFYGPEGGERSVPPR
jgi:mannose-6-phosphate isomerase-like protein (cupin superfamily)